MILSHDPTQLPSNLPIPQDDGACLHLLRAPLPSLFLTATNGLQVDLASLDRTVLFFYPRTGIPGQPPALGFRGEEWDSIPGARGCTPHSCGYRDLFSQFTALDIRVLGVSTNSHRHQSEFKARNHIPFDFLSDHALQLTRALSLATFEFPTEPENPTTMLARAAWYVERDSRGVPRIVKVWYPIFPPNENAQRVLAWLTRRSEISIRPADPQNAADTAFIVQTLRQHWHDTAIWSLGRIYNVDRLPALIALRRGEPVGLVTYSIDPGGYQCEVVTLASNNTDGEGGVGSALLDAAVNDARLVGCKRVFLTTTNDNLRAIVFYHRQGWRMAALHRGSMTKARELKPSIPLVAPNGIAIRDEIEFELMLDEPRYSYNGNEPFNAHTR